MELDMPELSELYFKFSKHRDSEAFQEQYIVNELTKCTPISLPQETEYCATWKNLRYREKNDSPSNQIIKGLKILKPKFHENQLE